MLRYLFYNILMFLSQNINYRKWTILILFDLKFSKYFTFIVLCNGEKIWNWVPMHKPEISLSHLAEIFLLNGDFK